MARTPVCLKLGRHIKALREKRGLSIAELSRLAGLSKGNLSDIESGNRDPRCSTLRAIARALKVTLSELVKKI